MRHFNKMPAYVGNTEADAKFAYAHDLLDNWMQPNSSTICVHMKEGKCDSCPFAQRIDHGRIPKCCGWALEANVDLAIIILEDLMPHAIGNSPLYSNLGDGYLIGRIAEKNGFPTSADITQEECAELIQSVSKWRRSLPVNDDVYEEQALDHVEEEIADVQIMLDQLVHQLKARDRVKLWRQRKIDRQLERMGVGE